MPIDPSQYVRAKFGSGITAGPNNDVTAIMILAGHNYSDHKYVGDCTGGDDACLPRPG